MRTRSQLFNANRYIKASINASPLRDPRGTSRTPSPSGTLTPPLNKLPPGFAVEDDSKVIFQGMQSPLEYTLAGIARSKIWLLGQPQPGGPLAGKEFPKAGEFCCFIERGTSFLTRGRFDKARFFATHAV